MFRRLLAFLFIALALASCANQQPNATDGLPYPNTQVPLTTPPLIRFWGDAKPEDFKNTRAVFQRQRLNSGLVYKPSFDVLALSGGGGDGAFGAGLLVGWTQNGTRPQFDIVTGVSTGSLIAPFAFLGSDYDAQLAEVHTTIGFDSVAKVNLRTLFFGGPAVASSKPLERTIARYVTPSMLSAIAKEHAKGRRLYVATTHLAAGRQVIWDMGAIAQSRSPTRLTLFRNVLLASTAIPGLFPPVEFPVEISGIPAKELHADGGLVSQVFIYPVAFSGTAQAQDLIKNPSLKLWIVRNGKLKADFKPVKSRLFDISARSIETLTRTQGIGDIYRIYYQSQLDKAGFNLAYIDRRFSAVPENPFDKAYMQKLFVFGYEQGRKGYQWRRQPNL